MPLPSPPPTLLQNASLFLDFDGTLVPIADRPDGVEVPPSLQDLLERLNRKLCGRLTLVSGRASADVLDWLKPLRLAVAGSHGLERPGSSPLPSSTPKLQQGLQHLRELQRRYEGVLVEEKPLGVALHYRQAPQAEEACRSTAELVASLSGLQVQPGKMVFELKPASGNKGSAVREMMSEQRTADTRPVFVGDDLTDEHGFVAARELGGVGVLVGEERPTAADYGLADVRAVHDWLQRACELLP